MHSFVMQDRYKYSALYFNDIHVNLVKKQTARVWISTVSKVPLPLLHPDAPKGHP